MRAAADSGDPRVADRDTSGPRTFLVLAASSLTLQLAFIWSGWTDKGLLADDAFYYFTIARSVVEGHGVTFDGLAPTNGFHPLWLLATLPIFALSAAVKGGLWFPVRSALTLAALLNLATGWMLLALLRRLGHPRGAVWAAGLWLLFPTSVFLGLTGMETSLNACVFAVLMTVMLRWFEAGRITFVAGLALGGVVGLSFLARTDNGVLAPLAVATSSLVFCAREGRPGRQLFAFLTGCACTAAILAGLWFAWNVMTFGSPWQVSGEVKLFDRVLGGNMNATSAAFHLPRWTVQISVLLGFVWRPFQAVMGRWGTWPLLAAMTALEIATLALLSPPLWREVRKGSSAQAALAAGAAVYLIGHAALYAFVMKFYVAWYAVVPTMVVLFLFVGLGADAPLLAASSRRRAAVIAALALIASYPYTQYAWPSDRLAAHGFCEREAIGQLKLIEEYAPGARTLGVSACGAVGYFAREVGSYRIVGLDCVVNNPAAAAWRRGEFYDYIVNTVDIVYIHKHDVEFKLGPEGLRKFRAHFPQWYPGSAGYGQPPWLHTRPAFAGRPPQPLDPTTAVAEQ